MSYFRAHRLGDNVAYREVTKPNAFVWGHYVLMEFKGLGFFKLFNPCSNSDTNGVRKVLANTVFYLF